MGSADSGHPQAPGFELTAPRFDEALRILVAHGARFIVVGGVAAILQGSPLTTEDLDIVFLATEDNIQRLLGALRELDAVYVDPAGRRIEPDAGKLRSMKLHLLTTTRGRLDVLRTIGDGLDFEALIPHTLGMPVEELTIQVLGLEKLIETKVQAGRPKDRFQLPYLRQLLAEIRRG